MKRDLGLGVPLDVREDSLDPVTLFAASEQGVIYDPSDFSSMFQDSKGVTPVTAVEQSVGLILDKRFWPVRNLVANADAGTFEYGTKGVVALDATISRDTVIFPGGGLKVVSTATPVTGAAIQTFPTVIGKFYEVRAKAYAPSTNTVTNGAAITVQANGGVLSDGAQVTAENVVQDLSFIFEATATTHTLYGWILDRAIVWGSVGDIAYFDSVSVREVTELVTNGAFETNITSWTAGAADLTWNAGRIRVGANSAGNGFAYQAITTVIGKSYEVAGNIVAIANTNNIGVGTGIGGTDNWELEWSTSSRAFRAVFAATATTTYLTLYVAPTNGAAFFDNISCRLLEGNHATQATAASRPVLSARVNKLEKSEALGSSPWLTGFGGTGVVPVVTNNYALNPTGTATTATRVQLNKGAGGALADIAEVYQSLGGLPNPHSSTTKVWAKSNDANTYQVILGPNVSGNTPKSVTPTWQQFTIPEDAVASTTAAIEVFLRGTLGTSDTCDILVWGFDYRLNADAALNIPAYQRVNTATDYDTVGFPHYLKFDGVDDSLATASIDFTATDKMTVWAGVHKVSDAVVGILAELNVNDASAGNFNVTAPAGAVPAYGAFSHGDAAAVEGQIATASGFAAPGSNVLTAQFSISGDLTVLRVNGVVGGTATADQGAGNYGNYPLYIGRRGGATSPFNGRLYGLIVRGAASTAATLARTEKYLADKMGLPL